MTLFHYRNTGNRESSVLMGVQVSLLSATVVFGLTTLISVLQGDIMFVVWMQ